MPLKDGVSRKIVFTPQFGSEGVAAYYLTIIRDTACRRHEHFPRELREAPSGFKCLLLAHSCGVSPRVLGIHQLQLEVLIEIQSSKDLSDHSHRNIVRKVLSAGHIWFQTMKKSKWLNAE